MSNINTDIPTDEQQRPASGRRSREDWEELALIYERAEKAAVSIQQKFRSNRQQSGKSSNSSSSDTEKDDDDSTVLHANNVEDDDNDSADNDDNNNNDKEHLFTLIFLAPVIALLTSVKGYVEKLAMWLSQCLTWLAKCCRGGNDEGLVNATQQSSNGVSSR